MSVMSNTLHKEGAGQYSPRRVRNKQRGGGGTQLDMVNSNENSKFLASQEAEQLHASEFGK